VPEQSPFGVGGQAVDPISGLLQFAQGVHQFAGADQTQPVAVPRRCLQERLPRQRSALGRQEHDGATGPHQGAGDHAQIAGIFHPIQREHHLAVGFRQFQESTQLQDGKLRELGDRSLVLPRPAERSELGVRGVLQVDPALFADLLELLALRHGQSRRHPHAKHRAVGFEQLLHGSATVDAFRRIRFRFRLFFHPAKIKMDFQ